jgi:uncharacterized protein (UPF0264 family)
VLLDIGFGQGIRRDHHAERDDYIASHCQKAQMKWVHYNSAMTMNSTRLLVSVRNVTEAEAALAGGCDVLDIKEPNRGAMGMADSATIAAVLRRVRGAGSAVPLSIALGEIADWEPERAVPQLPSGIAYLKLGTAGLGNARDWGARLAMIIDRFGAKMHVEKKMCAETASEVEDQQAHWIAVGYADWELARGPRPEEVIAQAAQCGCEGVLIDTFSKGDQRLIDWLSIERLESLAALARGRCFLLALAGRLQIGDIPVMKTLCPDIVGIRSAACRGGIRNREIDAGAVRAFREALQ